MINKEYSHKAQGFSLLELLLVVAVGAVLILAGLGTYKLVSESNNTNQTTRQLMTLKQLVQQTYAGQVNYGTTNASLVTTLNTMRALPSDMPVTGTNLKTAFGTTATIVASASNTFTITFNTIPKAACVKLGQVFTLNNNSDLISLTIGTTAVSSNNFTLTGLTSACSGTSNNMAWRFR